MNKKGLVTRIVCLILAGLMVAGTLYTAIYYLLM